MPGILDTIYYRLSMLVVALIGPVRAHYLNLTILFVRRELKVKYRGTFFGYLWSMLNPLLFMTILSTVLGGFVRNIEHYNLYLLSGYLLWNAATMSIITGTNSIVANAGLIRKVKIPFWVFPMVSLGTAFINFCLALLPFLIICLFKNVMPPPAILLLPAFLFFYFIFIFGLGLSLSSLNVFFRDIAHVLEPILQLMFYATPIFYSRFSLDHSQGVLVSLLRFNPFGYFIELGRSLLFSGPDIIGIEHLIVVPTLSVVSLSVGLFIYKRSKHKFIFNL